MVFKYPNYVYTLPSNSDMYFGMIPESDRRPVKCPVCGNWFYTAYNTEDEDYAEEEMSLKGSAYIIHIKAKKKHFETYEYIKKDEFTCPFLLKPILIDPDSDKFNKDSDSLVSYLDTHKRRGHFGPTIYPSKILPDIFRKYSDMMELNGTTCKHCGGKYKISYNKNGGKFSCSFGCECLSSENMPDLCRLAVDFDYKYRHEPRKRVERSKPSAPDASPKRTTTKASPKPSTPVVESNYIISHMPNGYIVFN